MSLRFDDSLDTVLAAEMSSPFGAQSAWRQLVDLIGRRRVPADAQAIAKLLSIRAQVPAAVRAASARALAFANPPAALVRVFYDDEVAIAAPVLRIARLQADEWIAMLPGMSPAARSVLRHRRDLTPAVRRALDAFGPDDFRLTGTVDAVASAEPAPAGPTAVANHAMWRRVDQPLLDPVEPAAPPAAAAEPVTEAAPTLAQFGESPFVSVGAIAFGLPVVAEALRRAEPLPPAETVPPAEGPFQIAELVARIDAYQRQRDDAPGVPLLRGAGDQPALFDLEMPQALHFRFETDAAGVVRWIEGAARAPLIGLSLDLAALPGVSRVDGVAGGAFRRRAGFADARLVVDGGSDAAGEWRITGVPVFDHESGRFTGYRGTARRPRADESAAPRRGPASPTADALRQLVHELRTPTNAIAGFAEMIETQLLGPVPDVYRQQAGTIRGQAAGLLTAIDDIDLAARLESHALDLRAEEVAVAPLLARVAGDLAPLADLRGTELLLDPGPADLAIAGDERAIERLVGRLMATLVASGALHEKINITASLAGDATISLVFDRPRALAVFGNNAILTIDAEAVAEAEGAPLLGTGFALRLARNLAAELGGLLSIDDRHLTLLLPAAVSAAVEQASSN
ncbi:HAMP domain-containing sensor histidine kinase [Sphingomonas sp. PB4P5]|uniref:HAMP domain-containing sensor histidine kinase n=1 Tax=Parasphingomonas puruogangriensis TaxID=3096155 RepID=UPI002FC95118